MIIKQSKTKFIFLLILFLSVFILLDPRLFVAEDVDFEMKAILGVIALVCVAGSVFIIAQIIKPSYIKIEKIGFS